MTAQTWVTLVVGLLATVGVVGTLWQRQRSEAIDRFHRIQHEARAEWWKRYEWAVERLESGSGGNDERGMLVLEALVESPLATASEWGIVQAEAILRERDDEIQRQTEGEDR